MERYDPARKERSTRDLVSRAIAREQGFAVHALSVSYGQRHTSELEAADRVSAMLAAVEHKTVQVDLRHGEPIVWGDKGVRLLPFMTGGRQERNRRAGTENVPALVSCS